MQLLEPKDWLLRPCLRRWHQQDVPQPILSPRQLVLVEQGQARLRGYQRVNGLFLLHGPFKFFTLSILTRHHRIKGFVQKLAQQTRIDCAHDWLQLLY